MRKWCLTFCAFASILIGIGLLIAGFGKSITIDKETQGFVRVDGYLIEYCSYSDADINDKIHHRQDTYALKYQYEVDGINYLLTTDYGTNILPKINSCRSILYDPNNPTEAMLDGVNRGSGLICVGLIFMMVPLLFCITLHRRKCNNNKIRISMIPLIIGIGFSVAGLLTVYILTGTFSFVEGVRMFGTTMAIPSLMLIVGLFQIIKGMCPNKAPLN